MKPSLIFTALFSAVAFVTVVFAADPAPVQPEESEGCSIRSTKDDCAPTKAKTKPNPVAEALSKEKGDRSSVNSNRRPQSGLEKKVLREESAK